MVTTCGYTIHAILLKLRPSRERTYGTGNRRCSLY